MTKLFLFDAGFCLDIPHNWIQKPVAHGDWAFFAPPQMGYQTSVVVRVQNHAAITTQVIDELAASLPDSLRQRHEGCQIRACDVAEMDGMRLCRVRYHWSSPQHPQPFDQATIILHQESHPHRLVHLDLSTIAPLQETQGSILNQILQSLTPAQAADCYAAPGTRHFPLPQLGFSLLLPLDFYDQELGEDVPPFARGLEHICLFRGELEDDEDAQGDEYTVVLALGKIASNGNHRHAIDSFFQASRAIPRPGQELLSSCDGDDPAQTLAWTISHGDAQQRVVMQQRALSFPHLSESVIIISLLMPADLWPRQQHLGPAIVAGLKALPPGPDPDHQHLLTPDGQLWPLSLGKNLDLPAQVWGDSGSAAGDQQLQCTALPGYGLERFEAAILLWRQRLLEQHAALRILEEQRWLTVDMLPVYGCVWQACEGHGQPLGEPQASVLMASQELLVTSSAPCPSPGLAALAEHWASVRVIPADV